MKSHNFKIIAKHYPYRTYNNIRGIVVSGVTIIAKNDSIGALYKSKYIDKIEGRFEHVAGSHRYPVLLPKYGDVVIHVKDFPQKPIIKDDYYGLVELIND